MSTTTIQIRVDSKVKKAVKRSFEGVGLDLSSGTKLLWHDFVTKQALPNNIRTVNGYTPAREREIIKETQEALRHGKRYTDVDQMMDEI